MKTIDIKARLLALPMEIGIAKLDLIDIQNSKEITQAQLKMWELTELANISNELDDKGKAKHSNDTKRKAELQHRIDTSNEYAEIQEQLKKLEKDAINRTVKYEKLINEQGNLRAICRLEGQD